MTSVIALVTMPPFEREPSVKGDVRRGAEGRPDGDWPSLAPFPKVALSATVLSPDPEAERVWYATGIELLVAGIKALREARDRRE